MPRRQQGKVPTGLGKALVNATRRPRKQLRADKASLHYADLTTLPSSSAVPSALASVTDRSALDEFLHSAMMAEEAFESEKQQMLVLESKGFVAKPRKREYNADNAAAAAASSSCPPPSAATQLVIPIPRRPLWTSSMSAEELQQAEREAFLSWRRSLAELEESSAFLLTPFEKNLEVWRQLWRVVERCSVVATIVDARNPLLYRSLDLERYVHEAEGGGKLSLLVINKADYLTVEQRRCWARHFDREGVRVVFFSAARCIRTQEERERRRKERARLRQERAEQKERGLILGVQALDVRERKEGDVEESEGKEEDGDEEEEVDGKEQDEGGEEDEGVTERKEAEQEAERATEQATANRRQEEAVTASSSRNHTGNSTAILTRSQLLDYFRQVSTTARQQRQSAAASASSASSTASERLQIGFVGYPNVGKSSTINALLQQKRVTVGATPGKTKHFQTLNVESDLTLCDCPGLVFPSFLASRAELVCNGVMPIDQMREYANYTAPVALLVRRVGAEQLRQQYSLVFPNWSAEEAEADAEAADGSEEEYRRRAEELLNAHARMRGWMKDHGRPDESRSARVLLKDLFTGKLLHCFRPPQMTEEERREWRRGEEKGRKGDRIVGEWKGDDVGDEEETTAAQQPTVDKEGEEAGWDDEEGAGGDEDAEETEAQLQEDRDDRGVREGKGKVNVRVLQQMLADEYDDDLPLQRGQQAASELSKKQRLRERQREKRRTGKQWKLKKRDVEQEQVTLRAGGHSDDAAIRMGLVQSSRDNAPHKISRA